MHYYGGILAAVEGDGETRGRVETDGGLQCAQGCAERGGSNGLLDEGGVKGEGVREVVGGGGAGRRHRGWGVEMAVIVDRGGGVVSK